MAQLWGGRFTKETDKLVYNFNASISFDQKFYRQDIRGSKAHVAMLAKQGILTEEEKEQITEGLDGILADVEAGKLEITAEYEDIHSFVEANLIDRIGDAGKKLHTGRSRNDQVALDMKLYVRDEIDETDKELKDLLLALQYRHDPTDKWFLPVLPLQADRYSFSYGYQKVCHGLCGTSQNMRLHGVPELPAVPSEGG